MESSEDDAGNATSASRRVSAREKDVGQAEDVDATSCYHQEPYGPRTTCGTPAMSEDNFDGDSVPSPSAQDVNTSTEAILDMIDEIVDGPGAPKRVPLSLETDNTSTKASDTLSDCSEPKQDSITVDSIDIPLPLANVSHVDDTVNENQHSAIHTESQEECSSNSTISTEAVTTESPVSLVPCTPELKDDKPVSEEHEFSCPVSSMGSEPSTSSSLSDIPSSNIIQNVQNSVHISESETLDRTVKYVSSSDNRDSVTVESAESTSSDCSLSEGKTICAELTTRSPLKRRLVRPAPSDRRPDSTVSSTADSQNVDVEKSKLISSENIIKDVSSSSDAVPPLQGSVKPEEIRNVSEISICKAETSVSPPKKIKLIRQKIIPTVCKNVNVEKHTPTTSNQCVSTISDSASMTLVENIPETSSSFQSSLKITEPHMPIDEDKTNVPLRKEVECTESISVESVEPRIPDIHLSKNEEVIDDHKKLESTGPSLPVSTEPILPTIEKNLITVKQIDLMDSSVTSLKLTSDNVSKQTPKLTNEIVPTSSIVSNTTNIKEHEKLFMNTELFKVSEPETSSHLNIIPSNETCVTTGFLCSQDTGNIVLPLKINIPQSSETPQESFNEHVLEPPQEKKKVPPLKLNLSEHSEKLQEDLNEKYDQKSSNIFEVSNVSQSDSNEVLNELSQSDPSDTGSEFYQEAEKKVPPIKLNISQLSDKLPDSKKEKQKQEEPSKIPKASDVEEGDPNKDLKVLHINEPSSSKSECSEEKHKKVPPIKLNLSQILDTSYNRLNEKQHSVISIPEPSNIESNTKPIIDVSINSSDGHHDVEKKVPPIKFNRSQLSDMPPEIINVTSNITSSNNKSNYVKDEPEVIKQVPKLTIKLHNKSPEECKSPIPKLTIKPIRPPQEDEDHDKVESKQQIPTVTKINIKAIPRPLEKGNMSVKQVEMEVPKTENEHIPTVMKLNIKPIPKPPEKINDIHRKSSSSEISESECSENDDSTSTSDHTSTSDNVPSDVIPKVTIKLGKPGTQSEGKFYTEQNVPKLTIKNVPQSEKEEQDSVSKLKVVISQSEDTQAEKIPKLTIKTVTKSESQPLSPKLTIKPIKPPDNIGKELEIPKLKSSAETPSSTAESKENVHVPKITIKPITKPDVDTSIKATKKLISTDTYEHIPTVTKLNIKPIIKPIESGECSDVLEEKVPAVSKLNIKPVIKPKDNEVDSSIEDVPKITKLNIKPLKIPELNTSEQKDCDVMNADIDKNSIPVITKLNIKPIVKPLDKEKIKDSENQSLESKTTNEENVDHVPVVTKLNIKPIVKPIELEEASLVVVSNEPSIPVITKLNIKPLVKPDEIASPASPKKDSTKTSGSHSPTIRSITKLNIKPIVKPDDTELLSKLKEDFEEKSIKKPPLVMKINMKTVTDSVINEMCSTSEYACNSIKDNVNAKLKSDTTSGTHSEVGSQRISSDKAENMSIMDCVKLEKTSHSSHEDINTENPITQNWLTEGVDINRSAESTGSKKQENIITIDPVKTLKIEDSRSKISSDIEYRSTTSLPNKAGHPDTSLSAELQVSSNKGPEMLRKSSRTTLQYCTLLKKLLENPKEDLGKTSYESKELMKVDGVLTENARSSPSLLTENVNCELLLSTEADNRHILDNAVILEKCNESVKRECISPNKDSNIDISPKSNKTSSLQDFSKVVNEDVKKPLEISVTEKNTNQSSGQDSPRIILKINKTDHGSSAKLITEDIKKSEVKHSDNTQQLVNDKVSPRKQLENCRKKGNSETPNQNLSVRTRLRSSRKADSLEVSPPIKQMTGKRPSSTEPSPPLKRDNEMSILDAKRLKLGQILSSNAMISQNVSISPVVSKTTKGLQTKPTLEIKQVGKLANHSILNNDNCSKNGNSKLHNILSNLHAKQKKMQSLPFNDLNCLEKTQSTSSEVDSNASTGSSEIAETVSTETQPIKLQEMLINENSDYRDLNTGTEELSQDPLEPESTTSVDEPANGTETPRPIELIPQPKKRGRPRKLPVTESPVTPILPVPALEERPQRSLRLTRERPVVTPKPRGGRGRGRGIRRGGTLLGQTPQQSERVPSPPAVSPSPPPSSPTPIDPTSSRIKLPRMTEALDKMPSLGSTPLSSNNSDLSLFSDRGDLKVVLEPTDLDDSFMKSPEILGRPKSGRGSRGGRWRTPRGRGRGRGGGRGAMYMKETMGIYGRVCGPATTTVQLFEEETCMMDDNATPAKPSHLIDEDSQSSVKSSTNESSKMKKSKFADLFDSNKVWTAADVKEYTWPPTPRPDMDSQVMMIQEQVAMFLGVKSFKRRYPELKRRTIVAEERDYVLGKGLVTEALCDLGITAVDASEVLDIMLSDYPHKYEEYRSHQRERQMAEMVEEPVESKSDDKVVRIEMKQDKSVDNKPEPPKIDPEKTRQDMAAAAIASASEWNARANALRRPACVDLQSLTVHVRRSNTPRVHTHVRPPSGFYPHALLPGQYQHWYREYTPDQLRYFPLNTTCTAPPPPQPTWECSSSSDGEGEGEGSRAGDEDDSDAPAHPTHHNKRKKLTKTKRSSQAESSKEKEEAGGGGGAGASAGAGGGGEGEVDTCRTCKLRLEANRKYTHERFLVCANCNAKLHPSCVELSADTIRKCREYPWQCAECKTCCGCQRPADDDKMLFCDLCDRGFHIYCVGLDRVPNGRWHCVECAICKSCGAREPSGLGGAASGGGQGASAGSDPPAEWHHQTKRGPGGHKCYSHSLCTPCARAYRIGRYCPLCERSFIGPKGTMQLVICKLCDRQLHQECVRQTVSSMNVLDYTCADCRRGGITSRAAAVRLAPRTIATLFMAKRRFNKYAHRQYLASRMAANAANDDATDATDATDTSADAIHMDFGD